MYQSCVATDEVVHGLSQVQFADRREHTECIAGQQNDILWMRTNTRYLCIRDVFYWISCSCVFCMGKMLRIRVRYIIFSSRTLWMLTSTLYPCLFVYAYIYTCYGIITVVHFSSMLIKNNIFQNWQSKFREKENLSRSDSNGIKSFTIGGTKEYQCRTWWHSIYQAPFPLTGQYTLHSNRLQCLTHHFHSSNARHLQLSIYYGL